MSKLVEILADTVMVLLLCATLGFLGCKPKQATPDEIEQARCYVAIQYAIASLARPATDAEHGAHATPHKAPGALPVAVETPPQINWVSEVDWRAEAQKTGKPVLMFFSLEEGCPPCEQIRRNVLPSQNVIEAMNRFVCVKIDSLDRMQAWNVGRVPTAVFVDGKTATVIRVRGVRNHSLSIQAAAFVQTLDRGYQVLKPQEEEAEDENSSSVVHGSWPVVRVYPAPIAGSRAGSYQHWHYSR
ncbi:MAG: thioredoxin family protein [Planctomycetales bacterium]|nr:thioredoxin family protein [Planctomycetales bacterium]